MHLFALSLAVVLFTGIGASYPEKGTTVTRTRCYDCNYAPSGYILSKVGWKGAQVGYHSCALLSDFDRKSVDKWYCNSAKCFIRRDANGLVYRGCANDDKLPWGVETSKQCSYQGQSLWWFCDGDLCNEGQIGDSVTLCGKTAPPPSGSGSPTATNASSHVSPANNPMAGYQKMGGDSDSGYGYSDTVQIQQSQREPTRLQYEQIPQQYNPQRQAQPQPGPYEPPSPVEPYSTISIQYGPQRSDKPSQPFASPSGNSQAKPLQPQPQQPSYNPYKPGGGNVVQQSPSYNSGVCTGDCSHNPSGLFKDPESSYSFIQCAADYHGSEPCTCCKATYLICPPGTVFNDDLKVCTETHGGQSNPLNQHNANQQYPPYGR